MKQLNKNEFFALSEADCIEIQNKLSHKVIQHNIIPLESIETVAGVDIAYWNQKDIELAVCCIVVIDFKHKTIIEKQHTAGKINFPYIAGCLAFRELPLIIETATKLKHKPDIFLFDGNGILHTRYMGLATHASFYLESPTIGIAKKYFKVEGASFSTPDNIAGCYSNIIKDNKILARAIRTHKDVKPIFASVGNYIDIDTVTNIALTLTDKQSHIPIPTRYADLETHIKRKELMTSTFC